MIVNAFLGNVSFGSAEAEEQIRRIIIASDEWPPHMLHNIDEVFRPIFFHYPNGLDDRTRAEPRDAILYIRQWREIAQWRHHAVAAHCGIAGVLEASKARLEDSQVQNILHRYVADFIANVADDTQKTQPLRKNRSRAEARLRRLCGSTLMAKVIWAVGLPNILLPMLVPATEQHSPPGRDVLDAIAIDTQTILAWLCMLATTIQARKATPAYQEHARKSGTKKHQSGLTEEDKQEKKRNATQKSGRRPS